MRQTPPLLEGSIPKQLLSLAIPLLLAMSFQTLYAVINLFFVGKLGPKAIAAVSISINAFFVILTLAQSLGVGGLALISQSWGRKEFNVSRDIFTQIVFMTLIIGLIAWLLAFFGADSYISFFTQDHETYELGVSYFRIYSATFFFQLFMMATSFCFRGSGDFMTPMRMMLTAVLMNIALDPLLIYGLWGFPKLGVKGAAIASVISQTVTSLLYLRVILKRQLNLHLVDHFRPNLRMIARILRIGLPSGLQYLVLAAVIMVTYRWVRPMGPDVAAAIGVGFRLLHASYLPMVALSLATSTLVGQNWGAQIIPRTKLALRYGLLFANLWALFITTLFIVFPLFFLQAFSSDPAVHSHGTLYLRTFGYSNFLVASIFIATATFQGLGKTMTPLIGALLKLLLYLAIWFYAMDSNNLYIIYGAALLGILVEMIWDLAMVQGALQKKPVLAPQQGG